MFSLLIGQVRLRREQQKQTQEEGAVFWMSREHGEFMLILLLLDWPYSPSHMYCTLPDPRMQSMTEWVQELL